MTLPAPGTSALAIWSLVLGILSFFTLGLTSIPGVICGHLARGKIKRSIGKLSGSGLAMAGLITGYIGLFAVPLLAAAGFAAGNGVQKTPRTTSLATATAIEAAVNNFNFEYGYMPLEVHQDTTIRTDAAEGVKLLTILLGIETQAAPKNVRGVKFLSVREGKNDKNGLIYSTDGKSVTGLYDPWGGGYNITLDGDDDESVTPAPIAGGGAILDGRRVAVWSDGADGVKGGGSAADDVKTW